MDPQTGRGISSTRLPILESWDQIGQTVKARRSRQEPTDYSKARNIRDKWKADEKMVKAIDRLPGKKSVMERVARGIIMTKKRLHL